MSLWITIWPHLASLAMPKGDPRDGFFYRTCTNIIDSYIVDRKHVSEYFSR